MNDKAGTTPTGRPRYRMPAEWEPHQATWLSWPYNEGTWPGILEQAVAAYAQMVAVLARSETVHINVNDATMEASARMALADASARGDIRFHHIPTNDAWCRDHGAVLVQAEPAGTLVAIDWEYNAWGSKYPPYDQDDQVAARMADILGVERVKGEMVLEGGSIDVNGNGVLLTTESCLLHPNRNPHLSRAQIEQRLLTMLGVDTIVWLGEGIVGDDTDGHVDDMTRFVSSDTVVTVVEDDPSDENYAPLRENLDRLKAARDQHGFPLRIIEIPMPPPVFYNEDRLPASYANFYIANRVVLVPLYYPPTDARVKAVLQNLFPTREIIGIDCTNIVLGLGAIHCLTQQIPTEGTPAASYDRQF